ncbi:hypothetical protein ANN_11613 [Periplaneta americana]|uniref:Reverse transcriptase domain-containing protein n=1 Tax=Periplaneta americana TaxID=6978 RepID=A0ABQ8T792_PERAM|nr:hypothetical protein ANN_11613 [Periplaneta americana]
MIYIHAQGGPVKRKELMGVYCSYGEGRSNKPSMNAVNALFPGRVISRKGDIAWPPTSPDLTVCDFFLWGHLKTKVFGSNPPRTIPVRKQRIREEVAAIPVNMLRGVMQQFVDRLEQSTKICHEIAKELKTFNEGEFIKRCLIALANELCPQQVGEVEAIRLSRRTPWEGSCNVSSPLRERSALACLTEREQLWPAIWSRPHARPCPMRMFATLESSDEVEKELHVNSAWKNIRDSIKISATQSIGYYETKKKKPWFDEDCCMVVERRKQAKLKFLQDPDEEKRDNYFNERREASRTLRNKKRGYLKEKLNEVETNSKNENIRDLYKDIKEFKNGYQPRVNVIKDENGDLLADSPSILNRWKNYFAQLLNVHRPNRNDRDEIEIQTAEPFIPEPMLSEVEIAIENLKKYNSPGIDQIPAELIQEGGSALYIEIYELVLAIWEKEIVPEQWKESIIVPIFKKGDKTNCGNFRGISLLLTSYKMLSNILLRRLTPYVYEIIGDHQCGFRRNGTTIDQIFLYSTDNGEKMGV